mgnify:CR=1 FL=1
MNDCPSHAESHLRHSATQAGTPRWRGLLFISADSVSARRKWRIHPVISLTGLVRRLRAVWIGRAPRFPAGGEERTK